MFRQDKGPAPLISSAILSARRRTCFVDEVMKDKVQPPVWGIFGCHLLPLPILYLNDHAEKFLQLMEYFYVWKQS